MQKIVLVLAAFLLGCANASPVLKPVSKGEVASAKEAINLFVKPVVTQGFGSDDEKQWKLDVSAYFTAFEVALVNNTSKSLIFDPQKSYLDIEGVQRFNALDEVASIQYYKQGEASSSFTLISKSKKKVAEETARIKAAGISRGTLAPGQQQRGLLFFKKVQQNRCKDVVLRLEGITVAETGEEKRFSFSFSCEQTG